MNYSQNKSYTTQGDGPAWALYETLVIIVLADIPAMSGHQRAQW